MAGAEAGSLASAGAILAPLIRGALRRAAHAAADRVVGPWLFDPRIQEWIGRRHFFYNAFKALRFNGIDGDYAEFGTGGGTTFALAYRESRRHGHGARLWGFDSFQGLPDAPDSGDHPRWIPGKMDNSLERFVEICTENGIPRDAYTLVRGYFDDTLPRLAPSDEPREIALAYVDCDLYSSTKPVLDFLRPRLRQGVVVAFDDYFCWSATAVAGERRAMLEFQSANPRWRWVPYVQFGWHGMSFVIEDAELAGPARPAGSP